MFLQIKLKRQDQNTHRFLSRDLQRDHRRDVYCLTRVTFEDTPSPFLSIATIEKHAKNHESGYPKAADEVKANMYVDDLLKGAPANGSALQLKQDLNSLLSKGGFEPTKWASNSHRVIEATPPHKRAPSLVPNPESESMSGAL